MMLGVTDHYIIPFALFLGATVQQVGWVSGLPNLLGSISQLFSVQAIQWIGGRLTLLIRAVSTQAALLLFIALLAWLDFPYRVELFVLLLVFFAMGGALAGPAWGSLMTDYIPMRKRGRYFLLFYRFKEVRPSREVSVQELFFSVVGVRPLVGISRD